MEKYISKYIITFICFFCLFSTPAMANKNMDTLIRNLRGSDSPLIEYDDAYAFADEYGRNFQGVSDLFLVNWNMTNFLTPSSLQWVNAYEQGLLKILSDNKLAKMYLEILPENEIDAFYGVYDKISDAIDKDMFDVNIIQSFTNSINAYIKDSLKYDVAE